MPDVLRLPGRIERAVLPELVGRPPAPGPEDAEEAVRRRAHQMLRAAEREAQDLMAAARAQAAGQAREGHREGVLQGRAEALGEARAALRDLAAALASALAGVRALERQVRAEAAEVVTALGLAVAERIVGEAAADATITRRAVEAALAALPEPGEVAIRVHPDHHGTLLGHRAELLAGLAPEGISALRLVPDAAVERGGCLLETPGCLVDATVRGRLEEARRRLLGEPA